MTVLATQLYDIGYENLMGTADGAGDTTAGEFHWVLATAAYTPADTHTTTSDLTICVDGDYDEIAVTDVLFTKTPGGLGETFWQGGGGTATTVVFGPSVDISAEYLVLVRNVTAPTFSATTSKLIFYIDLNATNQGNLTSTQGDFTITMPTNGWFKISQAAP